MSTKVATALTHVLADSYTLYLKTQNYHWNVEGERFNSLHAMFEEQYTELREAIDEIAERIRAIGAKAPGSYKEYQALSDMEDGNSSFSANDMVADLHDSHLMLAKSIQKAIDAADDADDDVSEDMMIARMTVHEKTMWMLRSSLPEEMREQRQARMAA